MYLLMVISKIKIVVIFVLCFIVVGLDTVLFTRKCKAQEGRGEEFDD